MLVTIRNKFILFLFGWGQFPKQVTAAPRLWRDWFFRKGQHRAQL